MDEWLENGRKEIVMRRPRLVITRNIDQRALLVYSSYWNADTRHLLGAIPWETLAVLYLMRFWMCGLSEIASCSDWERLHTSPDSFQHNLAVFPRQPSRGNLFRCLNSSPGPYVFQPTKAKNVFRIRAGATAKLIMQLLLPVLMFSPNARKNTVLGKGHSSGALGIGMAGPPTGIDPDALIKVDIPQTAAVTVILEKKDTDDADFASEYAGKPDMKELEKMEKYFIDNNK
ncbi:hypothetical protein CEXT_322991 [Caerostris extrusa]|uniref:Uncharacterized protein n=1 Tax=Caerostris extrusa TaxID=172846 RepID=A0AAV4N2P8_CAEEX|nr:hypothetical protein CEXT_322991 [Caerostris extrusa]